MNAFAAARDTLFTDPNLSRAATFTPAAGAAVAVRVIYRRPTETENFGAPGFRGPSHMADLRVSEVAVVARGAALAIADVGSFVVVDSTLDNQGGIHRINLRPA